MQLLVPITVIATTPTVKIEGETYITTIFLDLINRQTFTILRNAPETLEAAVLSGKFNVPGINHTVQTTPLIRQQLIFGEPVEEFYMELVITSDKLYAEDLLPESTYDTIQLA